MKRSRKVALAALAAAGGGLAIAVAVAHPGGMQHGGSMGMMGMMHSGDAAVQAVMQLVHEMLAGHEKIKRTVENLPDGIRTVTESNLSSHREQHVSSPQRPSPPTFLASSRGPMARNSILVWSESASLR